MKPFNEIEIMNDGHVNSYQLYSIMRPDIEKIYTEIEHFDARFIIKEPNGTERQITKVYYTPDAKPINPPKLSARDKAIEDYAMDKGPKPIGFTDDMLNKGDYVNGIRLFNDLANRAFAIGDVVFTISGKFDVKSVRELYRWVWKRGPAGTTSSRNDSKESDLDGSKNPNFALDLWTMTSFNGAKASSNIRIYDIDKGVYRTWKRIYKDFETQNVVMELE